ncbi:rhodanese-related sulfurtransferase [Chitinophaga sp. HK235]|uniref:oxygen-dependent tRNA uridine(34) hydroxylase TrhO n=1 Tax=Chitinophaga sp. HK235 TaxID=2952571 RepID=UPI001BAD728D|nr:rhodanese-related sulfurtransferase [Chitinophaga sp. HK235]
MVLHNRVSAAELKKRLLMETINRVTISFYQYAKIQDPQAFRDQLYESLFKLDVFGRIYVAHEGINAQISVPEHNFEAFRDTLYAVDFLHGIRLNVAVDDDGKSFFVLKIKVREKIVADGISDPTFDMANRGKYVDAKGFNALTDDPDTVIVDMRNHYEYEVGHFDGAIEIPSDTFRDQLPMAVDMLKDQKDKNIIMYCTGGIRCEKASAYMLHHGFKNVFHLEGGIIEYTNKARQQELPIKFKGKNFVFDDRLGERISEDIISQCHQCGEPCDTHTNCLNDGCHLLFIQCESCAQKNNGCCSDACKEVYALPEEERAELRKGVDKGLMFNKSRRKRLK